MKRFYTATIVQQSYFNLTSLKTHIVTGWYEDVKALEFRLQQIAREKDDSHYHTVNIVFVDSTSEVEKEYESNSILDL